MKATKHVVARYACGDGISSNFILNCVSKITVALYRYGLIVNNVVGDGATENRTACRRLATLTVEEVIGDFFTPSQKNILPMDFKIAYRHPIQDDVIIFIGGDMPHLIKKIANAFENSGVQPSRDLEFGGEKMSLLMMRKIWKCDSGRKGDLRTNILTEDHFKKNAYSRMRVHLAVQIFSTSMSLMIKAHAEKCGGVEKHMPLLRIVEKLDR